MSHHLNRVNLLLSVLMLVAALFAGCTSISPEKTELGLNQTRNKTILQQNYTNSNTSVLIANWNLQVFGQHKASNITLLEEYARVLGAYDIVFVQEIRDESGSAFLSLCARIPTHNCINSSRAGRSSSKEQVGVIYRKNIQLVGFRDFNPDIENRWERPPFEVEFEVNGYQLKAYNSHIDPDSVPEEIAALEQVVNTTGNVVVLGDLNADCSYYPEKNRTHFRNWTWVIPDGADTTVHATDCAYDRIILNGNATSEQIDYGIYKTGINTALSDHYLVWVQLMTRDN